MGGSHELETNYRLDCRSYFGLSRRDRNWRLFRSSQPFFSPLCAGQNSGEGECLDGRKGGNPQLRFSLVYAHCGCLRLEHPVAHLLIDKQGRTNIPQPSAPKQQSSSMNVFDLAVGHALLNRGEIYYNDRESSLDADVYDLRTDVTFDYLATRYRGSLSYAGGKLKYGTLAHLPHSLQTQFVATRLRFTLNPMILTLGSSRVMLRGEATNYSSPRVDGS